MGALLPAAPCFFILNPFFFDFLMPPSVCIAWTGVGGTGKK